jgi:hypothetical protein
MLAAWIASGRIAEPILLLTIAEALLLAALRRRAATYLPNILAGDFLLLAWRLSRHHWPLAAAALLGALLAHLADLWQRWRA